MNDVHFDDPQGLLSLLSRAALASARASPSATTCAVALYYGYERVPRPRTGRPGGVHREFLRRGLRRRLRGGDAWPGAARLPDQSSPRAAAAGGQAFRGLTGTLSLTRQLSPERASSPSAGGATPTFRLSRPTLSTSPPDGQVLASFVLAWSLSVNAGVGYQENQYETVATGLAVPREDTILGWTLGLSRPLGSFAYVRADYRRDRRRSNLPGLRRHDRRVHAPARARPLRHFGGTMNGMVALLLLAALPGLRCPRAGGAPGRGRGRTAGHARSGTQRPPGGRRQAPRPRSTAWARATCWRSRSSATTTSRAPPPCRRAARSRCRCWARCRWPASPWRRSSASSPPCSRRDYLVNPQVEVKVKEYQSQFVSVVGEVNSPGRKPLRGRTRLIDVLVEAGGFTPTRLGRGRRSRARRAPSTAARARCSCASEARRAHAPGPDQPRAPPAERRHHHAPRRSTM